MKKSIIVFSIWILLIASLSHSTTYGQTTNDYSLSTGDSISLPEGSSQQLFIWWFDNDGTPHMGVRNFAKSNADWKLNGKRNANPDEGILTVALGFDHATYTAPRSMPPQNPAVISVRFQPNDTTKEMATLLCRVYVVKASYKITMEAEQTISELGQDIKLYGECYANLKALPDGTYFLEPVDKTRNMHVTVEKAIRMNKNGVLGKLVAPYSYTFPFLFSIDKMTKDHSSGQGTVYLHYTSPQNGQVVWQTKNETETVDIDKGTLTYNPGGTTQIGKPGDPAIGNPSDQAGNAIVLSGMTNLNILNELMATNREVITQNFHQNISNELSQEVFVKRLQAHMRDPNYFKTPQGKADLQKEMAFQKQLGGNIANISDRTKQMNAQTDSKITNNPNYAGSKQFNQDLGKERMSVASDQFATLNPAIAKITPGYGTVRIKGNFNPKSTQSFTGEEKGAVGGVNVSLSIKVEKLSD